MKYFDLKKIDDKISNWIKKHKIISIIIALIFWQISWVYVLWFIWKNIPGKHSRKLKILGISVLGSILFLIMISIINLLIPNETKQRWEKERIQTEQLKQEKNEQQEAARKAKREEQAQQVAAKKSAERKNEIRELGLEDNATDNDISAKKKELKDIEFHKTTARMCSEDWVRKNVKSPKSVKFPFSGRLRNFYQDGFYFVGGNFYAKNSFNAEIQSRYQCKVKITDLVKSTCTADCELINR